MNIFKLFRAAVQPKHSYRWVEVQTGFAFLKEWHWVREDDCAVAEISSHNPGVWTVFGSKFTHHLLADFVTLDAAKQYVEREVPNLTFSAAAGSR